MTDAPAAAGPEGEADWDRLSRDASGLGVLLTGDQIAALRRYLELLTEWNQRFNLTAIQRPDEILVKHFLDSLTPALVLDLTRRHSLVDVGTGAGFPGLVLKIAYPHLQLTLLDAVQKRLNFLDRVAAELGLQDVQTVHARAEEAASAQPLGADAPRLREKFDVVTSRAVARLNVLAEWTVPFARVGGVVLALKGPEMVEEAAEAERALRLLGGGRPHILSLIHI